MEFCFECNPGGGRRNCFYDDSIGSMSASNSGFSCGCNDDCGCFSSVCAQGFTTDSSTITKLQPEPRPDPQPQQPQPDPQPPRPGVSSLDPNRETERNKIMTCITTRCYPNNSTGDSGCDG